MRFAERFGFRPAREAIQIDEMDRALRNSLWNLLTETIFPDCGGFLSDQPELYACVEAVWVNYRKLPSDTIDGDWMFFRGNLKKWYFDLEWYDVYDLIEFCTELLYEPGTLNASAFHESCNAVLEREMSGYRLVNNHFVRITSEQELAAVDATQTATGKFAPVSAHMRVALEHLTRREGPDYRNSIKESISAVEAACRVIAGKPKVTLGDALKALEKQGFNFHAAQKEAFIKLYGYTNDADGIRHSLLAEPTLTYEDAQFMLVTCSAFVNYLRAMAKL